MVGLTIQWFVSKQGPKKKGGLTLGYWKDCFYLSWGETDPRWKKQGVRQLNKLKAEGSWSDVGFKCSGARSGEIVENTNVCGETMTWVIKLEWRGSQEVGRNQKALVMAGETQWIKELKMMPHLEVRKGPEAKSQRFSLAGHLEEEWPNWIAWASNRRSLIIWKQQWEERPLLRYK